MGNTTLGGWEPANHSIQVFWPGSFLRSRQRNAPFLFLQKPTQPGMWNAFMLPNKLVNSTTGGTLGQAVEFNTPHSRLQSRAMCILCLKNNGNTISFLSRPVASMSYGSNTLDFKAIEYKCLLGTVKAFTPFCYIPKQSCMYTAGIKKKNLGYNEETR